MTALQNATASKHFVSWYNQFGKPKFAELKNMNYNIRGIIVLRPVFANCFSNAHKRADISGKYIYVNNSAAACNDNTFDGFGADVDFKK